MPESLQQKVDRMTAGMEVTVTFGGGESAGDFSVRGNTWAEGGPTLWVGDDRVVRRSDGKVYSRITAIDMPDPEPPFEMGARVLADGDRHTWTVTGWEFNDSFGAWMVWLDDGGISGLSDPDELTLVPPDQPPFQPGDKVRWNAAVRAEDDGDFEGTVDYCDRWRGAWRVHYRGYTGWDYAGDLELVPAEPDCPAILVTYVDRSVGVLEHRDTGLGSGTYGSKPLKCWLDHPGVATVQALRPTEYLRGGR